MGKLLVVFVMATLAACAVDRASLTYAPYKDAPATAAISPGGGGGGGGGGGAGGM